MKLSNKPKLLSVWVAAPIAAIAMMSHASAAVTSVGTSSVPTGLTNLSVFGISAPNLVQIGSYPGNPSSIFAYGATTGIDSVYYQNDDVVPSYPAALAVRDVVYRQPGGTPTTDNESVFGTSNWIALNNGTHSGWLELELDADGTALSLYFIFDPDRANGIPLSEAIAHNIHASGVPEFSSGMALGALFLIGGCSYRRRAAKR
jgi:hypothetical protein